MRTSLYKHRKSILAVSAAGLCLAGYALGQGRAGNATPPPPPINESKDPLLRGFSFRSIGPAVMLGRVDDIQGSEKDPSIIYIGFATGGLWKSTDFGSHFKPIWEEQPNGSIGAIGIAPSNPDIVYVGSGEANNRQSSSIGDGVWGTRDGGKTWTHLGLEKTQAIGRVAVDPTNPDIVYVAAVGHLFGQNPERGLYKTTDGGKNWKLAKYIDPDTGANDVAIDPQHPNIVYCSTYQRRRTWWGFNGGGPGSALWKSTDAGNTWTKLEGAGWPKPKDNIYGRIAISIYKKNPNIVYAQVESGASAGTGGGTDADGGPQKPGRGGRGGQGGFGANDIAAPAEGAPADAAAGAGGGQGRGGRAAAPPDPNKDGVFRSEDGGKTWAFMSNENQRAMYFSQIRVDPNDDKKIFVGGTPAQMSHDGGKTWSAVQGSHTDYHAFWIAPTDSRVVWVGHDGGFDESRDGGVTWDYHNDYAAGQFYQVSADMRRPYYVCGGLQDNNAWCGPSALRSNGGGGGGNGAPTGANGGPSNADWYTIAGGDGFYTRQDPTDWAIAYGESQDGNMSRHDLRAGTQKSIRPNAGRGNAAAVAANTEASAPAPAGSPANAPATPGGTVPATPGAPAAAQGGGGGGGRGGQPNVLNAPDKVDALRFYWNAPFEISPHNPAVVYMAAQYFFKSTNRGDTWWMNTSDLTKNVNRWSPEMPIMNVAGDKPMASKHDGYAASSLATQVRESPSRPGVLWIGTDDGNLQISQNGGQTFTNVYNNMLSAGAPRGYVQVSRIEPSHFDPATAYVALDNHRNDDWKPYLMKTTDYGKTWTNVTANLPQTGPIQALREDYDNPNLLFLGTEFGLFVTLDGSKTYKPFMTGLPNVPVDDILIHPRDRDLILATHGRSIWICDDITPLEQMGSANGDVTLFQPRDAVQWKNDPSAQRNATNRDFKGSNPQGGTAISIWAKSDLGQAHVDFLQGTTLMSTLTVDLKAGMNRIQWGMQGVPVNPAAANAAGGANGGGNGRRGGRNGGGNGGNGAGRGGNAAGGDANAAGAEPPATPPANPDAAQAAAFQGGGGGGRRGGGGRGVPFVFGGGRGGGGGFGGGGGATTSVIPGVYTVRLTVGDKTAQSSVTVLEDIWMRPQ